MIYDLAHRQVALLVIDVQREYFDETGPAYVPDALGVLPAINDLGAAFRNAGLPVVVIRHAHRADGSDTGRMNDFPIPDATRDTFVEGTPEVELFDGLVVADSDIRIVKRRYNSFVGTELDTVLRSLGARAVVVCGYMTSFCCETTARAAHDLDYETLLVHDAVAGPDLEHLDGAPYPSGDVLAATCAALAGGFAEVVDTADVVARISS